MKKLFIATVLFCTWGWFVAPAELSAEPTISTTQVTPKKTSKKSTAKKSSASKKYVPASIGDCYLGEAMYYQGESENIELTLLPDGTCEWKVRGTKTYKGTYSGTITGRKYLVKVNIPNVGSYTFKGTKEEWSFEGPRESIILNLEH